jgi:hypothetical protein
MYYNYAKQAFCLRLMNSMPSSLSNKIHLIIAGITSLLAQGILLIPSKLEFILQYLPSWGSVAIGAALFAISMLSFFNLVRTITTKDMFGWRANATLLAIQALAAIGLILLLESSAPVLREAGFLLSGGITALTTYGIFHNASSVKSRPSQLVEKVRPRSVFMPDPSTDINALNEQIKSLTHQLTSEKHRTTQLTLLNELSQQLEAELDPPVSAQLAVNTLERAMDCSIVVLMM